jgi:hypothetical protein
MGKRITKMWIARGAIGETEPHHDAKQRDYNETYKHGRADHNGRKPDAPAVPGGAFGSGYGDSGHGGSGRKLTVT